MIHNKFLLLYNEKFISTVKYSFLMYLKRNKIHLFGTINQILILHLSKTFKIVNNFIVVLCRVHKISIRKQKHVSASNPVV